MVGAFVVVAFDIDVDFVAWGYCYKQPSEVAMAVETGVETDVGVDVECAVDADVGVAAGIVVAPSLVVHR